VGLLAHRDFMVDGVQFGLRPHLVLGLGMDMLQLFLAKVVKPCIYSGTVSRRADDMHAWRDVRNDDPSMNPGRGPIVEVRFELPHSPDRRVLDSVVGVLLTDQVLEFGFSAMGLMRQVESHRFDSESNVIRISRSSGAGVGSAYSSGSMGVQPPS
jgi:hypothetical protein